MKNTRFIIAAMAVVLLLSGCKKNYKPISDHPFDITTPKIEATRVKVDVIPDNNDFCYMAGVAPAEPFELLGQDEFIALADSGMKEVYKILFETESLEKFPDWMYRGADDGVVHDLTPGTKYIAYAYPYNDTIPMAEKFTKIYFTTPDIKTSENTFSLSVNESVISVTPSNDDSYYLDYCSPEDLAEYYGSIDYFFRKSIDIYWEYGFLDGFIAKGPSKEDMKEYYKDMADGDIYYAAISGYDEGITTEVSYYKITVHFGTAAQSTIEKIPDFDHSELMEGAKSTIGKRGFDFLRNLKYEQIHADSHR